MKRLLIAGALTVTLAGCGSSAAAPKTKATPASVARVATIPMSTPAPIKHMTATVHGTPPPTLAVLPTAKPRPVASPTPIPESDYTATISGSVTDAKTGRPLANALIIIGTHRLRTNASGQYTARFPAGAPVPVTVDKSGYIGGLALGVLRPNQHTVVNFKLSARTGSKPPAPPPPSLFGQT